MNKLELKSAIVRKGLSAEKVAERIGVNRATFYRRMNNGSFTVADVSAMKELLELSESDISLIFLS